MSATVVEVDGDRCDACPASAMVEAFVFVEMPSGHPLAYCAHHGTLFMAELIRQHATVVDMRHLVSA